MFAKFLGFFIVVDEIFEKIIEKIIVFSNTYLDPLFATTSFTFLFLLIFSLFIMSLFLLLPIWQNKCEENFRKSFSDFISSFEKFNEEYEKEKEEINKINKTENINKLN